MLDSDMLRRSCLLAFVALLPVFADAATPVRRNIILITVDTTRADRMGFLGSNLNLTPNLDVLAHDGVVFTRAYSQVPLTSASHATILTGTYPQFHNVTQPGQLLGEDLPYAPDILKHAGYHTAAFVGSLILQAKLGGAPGFDRGFDEYSTGFRMALPGEDRYSTLERRADTVLNEAFRWIQKNSQRHFFVWIHLYDPHAPYEPPEPFATRFKPNPYDGEIAYVDWALGRFFARLRTSDLYDGALIAMMADHGEALGEHGERGHGLLLYDSTIHVPLVLKLPRERSAGLKVEAFAELVDVLPTILETVGVAVPKAIQGHSLMSQLHSAGKAQSEDRSAYAETDYPQSAFGWSPLRSLRRGKYLFVHAPRLELYDQHEEPAEDHDLTAALPAVSGTLLSEVTAFREKTRSQSVIAKSSVDPQQAAQLRALGYLTSGSESGGNASRVDVGGIDSKDQIELGNQISELAIIFEQGRHEEAMQRLQAIIAKDPSAMPAYDLLALIWMKAGNLQSAIAIMRKAVQVAPDYVKGHFRLAMLLVQARDLKEALPELELTAAGMPDSAQVHYELARLYLNEDRLPEAKKAALRVVALQPGHYESNLMVGLICMEEENASAAISYLQAASEARPQASEPHEYLFHAYEKVGNQALAKREQESAARLKQSERH